MLTLLTLYFAGGFILSIISLPLVFGKIKPNPFYGFRVAKTLTQPSMWYAVNRYSGRLLFYCGLGIMIAAIGFYLIPGISIDIYALLCLGVFTLLFSLSLFFSIRYMNKIDK